MTVKAIETQYKGYRFRSRLEARWAVFFDALGIEWQYEVEGYELPDGTRYLPDFFLPGFHTQHGIYVEVKGPSGGLHKPRHFAKCTGFEVLLAVGEPACKPFEMAVDWIDGEEPLLPWLVAFKSRYLPSMRGKGEYRMLVQAEQQDCEDEAVELAVYQARGARFEFGESGARK